MHATSICNAFPSIFHLWCTNTYLHLPLSAQQKNQPSKMRLVQMHGIGMAFVKWTFGKMQMSLCGSFEYCALSLPLFI